MLIFYNIQFTYENWLLKSEVLDRWQKYNLVYEKKQIDTSRKRGSASIDKYFCIQNYHKNRKLSELADNFQA